MSRTYANGKIYSIRSHQTNEIYIGSTITTLSRRLTSHRGDLKKKNDGKSTNCTSFKLLAYSDYYIELIEAYPCANKNELERREGQIIRETDNCVNKFIAGRTQSEYYQDNKEALKQNRIDNIEHFKAKDKLYYENNKDVMSEKHKEWRIKNEVKNKAKISCYCGGRYNCRSKTIHFKTPKHKDFEEEFKRVFEDSDSE